MALRFRYNPLLAIVSALVLTIPLGEALMAQDYPFIDLSQNVLKVPSEQHERFLNLRQSMQDPLEHNVRILHFGDSHLQADFFPERMRALLNVRDRGFVFPFGAVNSNNPTNFQVTKHGHFEYVRNAIATASIRAGLSGAAATTSDSAASIQIKLNSKAQCKQFSRVRLFHDTHRGAPELKVSTNVDILYQFTNKAHNYSMVAFWQPTDSLNISWDFSEASDTEGSLYGVFFEGTEASITYSGLGVNGAKIQSLDYCSLLESQLLVCRPDLIILSYGANDSYNGFDSTAFITAYRSVLAKIRKVLPDVLVILTTPGDARGADQRSIAAIGELRLCMHSLAQTERCALWDFYSVMGGSGSMRFWFEAGLSNKDGLHLIKKGYELQADLFDQALRVKQLSIF